MPTTTTDVGIEGGVREAMPMERRVALLPKECQGHKLKVIDLPDPSTGKARAFAFFDGGEGGAQEAQILEATWYKSKNSSWFVQEKVVSDGGLVMYTKMSPALFLLPSLCGENNNSNSSCCKQRNTNEVFRSAEDVLDGCGVAGVPEQVRSLLESGLGSVCDAKEAGGDYYFRYSEERALRWLGDKVDVLREKARGLGSSFAALDGEGLTRYAVSYLGEYLPPGLAGRLAKARGLEPAEARPATVVDRRAHTNPRPPRWARSAPPPAVSAAPKPVAKLSRTKDTSSMKISSFFQRRA
ncbi:subunit B of ribonuclease H2 [Chloropicon roscoffensis]|uniref:Ribonuclease H2 subunit B n=1 Tax=Chloropicon roscoffensis TaxID=1461544 RepID=A0AAX4PCV5_9CHLO